MWPSWTRPEIDDVDTYVAGAYGLVGMHTSLHLEREVLVPALIELAGIDLVSDLTIRLTGG